MAVIQVYVFMLSFYCVCSFLEGVGAQDRLTSLEIRFEILEQKLEVQTVEMSELRLKLEEEKTARMILVLELESMKSLSQGSNVVPNILQQLTKDFALEKNKSKNVSNEIDEVKSAQHNLSERLENAVTEMINKHKTKDRQSNKTIHNIKQEMANIIETVNDRFKSQKQLALNNKIAFSAMLSAKVVGLNSWQVLVFKNVLTNVGNGYSPITGAFTVPTNGFYVFFAHVLGADKKALEMCLRVNDITKMYMYANGLGHGRDANMVVLKLKAGDKVTINKHGAYGSRPFYVHPSWSTFSGFSLFVTD